MGYWGGRVLMDSDQREELLPRDQTNGVPSASYLRPNLARTVSYYYSLLANSVVRAIVDFAPVDHYHMVPQVMVNMLAVLVYEKEEQAAGISVPVVGVAAGSHVKGFLSEGAQCFEKAYFHWDAADSKSHYSYVYRTSSYLLSRLLILCTFISRSALAVLYPERTICRDYFQGFVSAIQN
jgi:hypothetical protein